MTPELDGFIRYLSAKKSVDTRALNRQVQVHLRAFTSQATDLRVLEVAGGTGIMLERLLEEGILQHGEYWLTDAQAGLLAAARRGLADWAERHHWQLEQSGDALHLRHPGRQVTVHTIAADALSLPANLGPQAGFNLLIANAFLDLVNLEQALPALFAALKPGAAFYFTINFDGRTTFLPSIDAALDEQIEALYHQTMDKRLVAGQPAGHSRTGSRLFTALRAAGAKTVAAGSSDWVVQAGPDGQYPQQEANFLHFILNTVEQALLGNPALDLGRLQQWVDCRRTQVNGGELIYLAHQYDFFGYAPA